MGYVPVSFFPCSCRNILFSKEEYDSQDICIIHVPDFIILCSCRLIDFSNQEQEKKNDDFSGGMGI